MSMTPDNTPASVAVVQALTKRLRQPPFGTETSERNLMSQAADMIDRLAFQQSGGEAEIVVGKHKATEIVKLPELARLINGGAKIWSIHFLASAPATDAALREALGPFVKALDDWGDDMDQPDQWNIWEHPTAIGITLGDLRKAKTAYEALAPSQKQGDEL